MSARVASSSPSSPPSRPVLPPNREWSAHDLLLRVLWARDEVDGLHVPHVDLVTENVGEHDLGEVPARVLRLSTPPSPQTARKSEADFFF